jgi:hypothetical protein
MRQCCRHARQAAPIPLPVPPGAVGARHAALCKVLKFSPAHTLTPTPTQCLPESITHHIAQHASRLPHTLTPLPHHAIRLNPAFCGCGLVICFALSCRLTENRDIAMDGQSKRGATGRGKTLLTRLALAHHRLRRSTPSITRPVAPRPRTILARSKKLHILRTTI